jgi:hypothetical protein
MSVSKRWYLIVLLLTTQPDLFDPNLHLTNLFFIEQDPLQMLHAVYF